MIKHKIGDLVYTIIKLDPEYLDHIPTGHILIEIEILEFEGKVVPGKQKLCFRMEDSLVSNIPIILGGYIDDNLDDIVSTMQIITEGLEKEDII